MRSFMCAFLLIASVACRNEDFRVLPPRPELVEVVLDETGYQLSFLLPGPEWHRVESDFKGYVFGSGERTLRIAILLKRDRFESAEADARAESGMEIRAFEPGSPWPFVGVVVAYRGPPDDATLEMFRRSFKVERR
ncbi:MAG TPA: hypothetical protein VL283_04420 [Candidatus Baltobacteraceae bacterium]|nr:hypothetical protein [Candidatus Baltobacteraceae bacterium]